MSPIAAGTAIGAAALTVGRGLLSAASGGLSFTAQLAQAAAGGSNAVASSSDQHSALRQAFDARLEAMRDRIQRLFSQHSIQLTQPANLISDGLGGIELATPHPQQAAIQEALASDILLQRDFNQLLTDASEITLSDAGASSVVTSITIPTPTPR